MHSLFTSQSTISLFVAAAAALLMSACDRNPTDPPQPTTQGTEREDDTNRNLVTRPDTPATPPPVDPVTPGQPVTPGGGTGTPGSGTGTQ